MEEAGKTSKRIRTGKTKLIFKAQKRLVVAKQICDAFMLGGLVGTACDANGISHKTFCEWRNNEAEIQEMFEAAQLRRTTADSERMRYKAISALERKLEPEIFKRTIKEGVLDSNGKMVVNKVVIFEEIHQADFRAIKEALLAFDPAFKKDEGVTHLHVTFDDDLELPRMKLNTSNLDDDDEE